MLFMTTAYGNEYVPFLATCINSIYKTHPDDDILVLYDDIKYDEIDFLKIPFPKVEFKRVNHGALTYDNIYQRVPLKLRYWVDALKSTKHKTVCFLDCDTVIYKNIDEFITDDYDFLYTWKDETFPLNVGVVIINNSDKILAFAQRWLEITEEIVHDGKRIDKGNKSFGAADQAALAELMDKQSYDGITIKNYDFGEIRLKGVPCELLNQTNNRRMECGSYIFHYKTGWHPILLKHADFTVNRPREDCFHMYKYWENEYFDINEYTMHKFIMSAAKKWKNILDWDNIVFEERGILHSEMLAVISTAKELKADVIIESGRCRGQSTYALAKAFENDNVRIVSIEWMRDENADFAEERLKDFKNLELLYGDSHTLVPEIVEHFKDKRIVILFDGPKGADAYRIFSKAASENKNILAGFFHDCVKSYKKYVNPSRDQIYKFFDRVWLTDNEEYVREFKYVDKVCIGSEDSFSMYTWRPYHKCWYDKTGSYGPTIGIVFPTARDFYKKNDIVPVSFSETEDALVFEKNLKGDKIKIVIFGAGYFGDDYAKYLLRNKKNIQILGFMDNNASYKYRRGIPVYTPSEGLKLDFDRIYIAIQSEEGRMAVYKQLLDSGVNYSQITVITPP